MDRKHFSPSLFLDLILIVIFPSLLYVGVGFSSLGVGLLVGASLVLCKHLALGVDFTLIKFNIRTYLIITFVLLFFSGVSWVYYGTEKTITVFPFLLIIFSALVFSGVLLHTALQTTVCTTYWFVIFLLFWGWLGLGGIANYGPFSVFEKAVFPFAEYSHFALAVGACSIIIGTQLPAASLVFLIVNFLALSLLLPSTTMLVFSLILAFQQIYRVENKRYLWWLLLLIPLVIIGAVEFLLNIDYFASRADLDSKSNTTTLVWLQGLEFIATYVSENSGLGIGFQTLGFGNTGYTESSILIFALAGAFLNSEDGGFLAAKIISEFGIFGVLLIVSLSWYFCYYLYVLLKDDRRLSFDGKRIFYMQILLSIIVELYFRGNGYFSPGVYLAFVGLFAIRSFRSLPQG